MVLVARTLQGASYAVNTARGHGIPPDPLPLDEQLYDCCPSKYMVVRSSARSGALPLKADSRSLPMEDDHQASLT